MLILLLRTHALIVSIGATSYNCKKFVFVPQNRGLCTCQVQNSLSSHFFSVTQKNKSKSHSGDWQNQFASLAGTFHDTNSKEASIVHSKHFCTLCSHHVGYLSTRIERGSRIFTSQNTYSTIYGETNFYLSCCN